MQLTGAAKTIIHNRRSWEYFGRCKADTKTTAGVIHEIKFEQVVTSNWCVIDLYQFTSFVIFMVLSFCCEFKYAIKKIWVEEIKTKTASWIHKTNQVINFTSKTESEGSTYGQHKELTMICLLWNIINIPKTINTTGRLPPRIHFKMKDGNMKYELNGFKTASNLASDNSDRW